MGSTSLRFFLYLNMVTPDYFLHNSSSRSSNIIICLTKSNHVMNDFLLLNQRDNRYNNTMFHTLKSKYSLWRLTLRIFYQINTNMTYMNMLTFEHSEANPDITHCVKSVRIGSYSGPYFPAFGLNTDQDNSEYRHFLRSDS